MARELEDVLHYFLPPPASAPAVQRISVPLAARDVVRLALLWNLAVEAARQGARAALVVPRAGRCAPWLRPGSGPLGVDVTEVEADCFAALAAAADEATSRLLSRPGGPALVLVGVPIEWLRPNSAPGCAIDRVLLLMRPEERGLVETWAALEFVCEQAPQARIGVSLFGVASLAAAQRAFEGLAALIELEFGRPLASYGVLIDDVQLSRSILSQQPFAISQPDTPAG
jgi:hypothetical protein